MPGRENTVNQTAPSGAERRAYERHPIHLPAEIVIEDVGTLACTIRDYCLGGMLLVFEDQPNASAAIQTVDIRLAANDLIGIHCSIHLEGRQNKLRFKARIAHTDPGTAGVAFVNPDLNALQLIRQFARQHPALEYQSELNESQPNSSDAELDSSRRSQLINQCDQIVMTQATTLIAGFYDLVSDKLFHFAKETSELSIQNAFFQSLSIINNSNKLFQNKFIAELRQQLSSYVSNQADTEFEQDAEFSSGTLELVADDAFEKWLAVSTAVNRIESEYIALLSPLEKRLSVLFNEDINKKNNPYSPSLFINAFQKALEPLEIAHTVTIKCHQVFSETFFKQAKTLYTQLNKFLIEQDILPVIKPKPIINRNDATVKNEQDTPNDVESADKQIQSDEKEMVNEASKATSPVNDTNSDKHVVETQDLYALVGELRQLQQQIRSSQQLSPTSPSPQGSVVIPANAPQATTVMASPAFSKPELLAALNSVKFSHQNNNASDTGAHSIIQQILSKLNTGNAEADIKTIAQEETYVIDVAENVITTLLADQQVANSVRPWIEKLGIPVIKMALLDKSLFVDKSHVVRQVINKLADLEILAQAEDDEDQQAIKRAFAWVVDLINNQFDGTTQVFTRAMQQLEMLNKIQQQAYEKNLKLVINDFMQEEREVAEQDDNDSTIEDGQIKSDEWLRRVRRLKEGHWVLFDANSEEPRRLKVAWIAERSGKYVFVNVMGRKDTVIKATELADLFRTADAIVLDGQDEPVMDRAQYTMLQNLHKQLLYQASHDEKTGLINRREFENCLHTAIQDAIQSDTKHAVCLFDIDKFKLINSSLGYEAGDELITEFISLVKRHLDHEYILARVGADDFGLILQEMALDDAMSVIEDIMIALEEFRFQHGEDKVSITLSAGLAIINAQSVDVTSIMQATESSCQLAKEMGGNRIQIFHSGSSRLAKRKNEMTWANKIDNALEDNQLYLRCQKIAPIQLLSHEEAHYEILLGLADSLGGLSALSDFIQAAERYNKMPEIDRWLIHSSFSWLAEHEDMLRDIAGFTLSLSGYSLNDDSLIDYIYQQVRETAVPIEKIIFEITETVGISNLSDAADFINTIKGTGCRFSLGDFGTGSSSYAYLKTLPVDFLKIDGNFIKNIQQNPSDHAIVKSICEIGHFMEKQVIAKAADSPDIINIIKSISIDYAQGSAIEEPALLEELIK